MSNKEEQEAKPMLWAGLTAISVGIAFIGIFLLTGILPEGGYWPTDFAGQVEALRNLGLIALGGFGIWLAWRRIVAMEVQNKTGLDSLGLAMQEHRDERFERNVSLLESQNEFSQIAALMGLRKIAEHFPDEYLERTIELVCAFIRKVAAPPGVESVDPFATFPAAAQEALEVLRVLVSLAEANPHVTREKSVLDLSRTKFDEARFSDWRVENMNLRESSFEKAVFSNCSIKNCWGEMGNLRKAIFQECEFVGDFSSVEFRGAKLTDCDISDAFFMLCDFSDITAVGFKVDGARFDETIFQFCQVDRAEFGGSQISATFDGVDTVVNSDCELPPRCIANCYAYNESQLPKPIIHKKMFWVPKVSTPLEVGDGTRFLIKYECEGPADGYFD